jgi:hypothetical protein
LIPFNKKKETSLSSRSGLFFILILFLSQGCATYYQKSIQFQEQFVQGDFVEANNTLDKNKSAAKNQNRLLYFLQKGTVLQLLGNYEESNTYFEEAYVFLEDYKKNYGQEAVSLLINATIKTYIGEDHEVVLLHYFKAMNYLQVGAYDEALVECRRINNKLNQFNDKYEKKKNRYKQDAFALNLMGITYDASGDINNAFIAYRNAYDVYKNEYQPYFNTAIPEQLKNDLLRTAYLNGFTDELRKYEKEFGASYTHQENKAGEMVFFWHNGLGPVKDEWSINFFIVQGQGGVVMFVNEELGLNFPFPLPAMGSSSGGLGDLKFIRIAFPKYIERKPYFQSGELSINKVDFPLEMAENINEIAFKTLEDRMNRELATSLLRLALKQAAEAQTSKSSENLGALLSVLNAVTEKADTRNWQTLPYSIAYARVPLAEGDNAVELKVYSPLKSRIQKEQFKFTGEKGKTIFHIYHNLESIPPSSF